eukprot:CAMPEP_0170612264 /NCGR_PEP_ID=MMETSP0224-20130122/23630_1 /TAXON_ID=285029 /ORGANISM="Togula jolla, Strain CCCM 725" /LENGTH=289 /DNA_ID=CAMNT_0010937755 /DNA_START=45 /DNA_END=914 /DNA_ORIENTATION=-
MRVSTSLLLVLGFAASAAATSTSGTAAFIEARAELGRLRATHHAEQSREAGEWVPFVKDVTLVTMEKQQVEEARFVVIVSAQRSASSSLAQGLSQQHDCIYNCNEFFGVRTNKQCRDFKHSGEGEAPLGRILLARDDLCEVGVHDDIGNPGKPATAAQECRHSCIVALKLFVGHGLRGQELEELLSHSQARVVVLERDPQERWCSLQEAEANNDWGTDPSHWKTATDSSRPPCLGEVPADLLEEHQGWYDEARRILSEHSISHIEVPFDAFARDSEAVIAKIWEFVEAH